MSIIRRGLIAIVVGLCAFSSPAIYAQTDAEIALGKARTAFADDQFEQARDLLITAAQTDGKNPDIHLLLGKSHYQLGEVQQAMRSWETTLRFAPNQAYAKEMIQKLKGDTLDADTRLALAAALLEDRLYPQASSELVKVQREGKLNEQQRHKLLLLGADLALGTGNPSDALRQLEELSIRFPARKDELRTKLLAARSQVQAGGHLLAAGLETLETLSKNEAEKQLAARADLELLAFRFQQESVGVDAVLGWIEKNADHPALPRANEVLLSAVERLLTATLEGPPVKPGAKLSAEETKALALAAKIYPTLLTADPADALTRLLVKHFQTRYKDTKSLATARAAIDDLAKLPLTPSSQRFVASAQRQIENDILTAEYTDIASRLSQNIDASAEMLKWIAAHPEHAFLAAAQQSLLKYYLAASNLQEPTTIGSPLGANDSKAIALAADIHSKTDQATARLKLTNQLIAHLKARYVASGALAAAQKGLETLLAQKLPTSSQVTLLKGLAEVQTLAAMKQLTSDAKENRLKAGPLPKSLQAILATLKKLNTLTPATPSYLLQAKLGQQVASLSSSLSWPAKPAAAKTTQSWAIEILLPVIADGHQVSAVKAANTTIQAIVTELAALPQPSADGLAVDIHNRRLNVLDKTSDSWTAGMLQRAALLNAHAQKLFERNLKQRRPDANAKLSDPQKALIATLVTLVKAHPSQASAAVNQLQATLIPALTARHYDVAQQAYSTLQPALPAKQQFELELAQLRLLTRQVTDRDALARQKGFSVKAELDPLMKKALLGAYELQRGLDKDDPKTAQARSVVSNIASYYRSLEMYDVVAAVLAVRAEKGVPAADTYAEYLSAILKTELAQREQRRLLKEYQGREAIKFTPAFAAAEAALQKFITDHPNDSLASAAVDQLFAMGRVFENQQRDEIAATVYQRIEKFTAAIDILNRVPVGEITTAERATLAAANARQQHALRALNKVLKSKPADAAPPEALSNEYKLAIAAYRDAIKKYPDGPVVKTAITRTLAIGLEYANRGAWDVADGVYGGVLEQKLPLKSPERLELARALCQLGKVLPDHARQVLATMVYQTPRRPEGTGEVMVAGSFGRGFFNNFGKDDLDARELIGSLVVNEFRPRQGGVVGQGAALDIDPSGREKPADAPVTPGNPTQPVTALPGAQLPDASDAQIEESAREALMLAAVQRQQGSQATQIAQLRDSALQFTFNSRSQNRQSLSNFVVQVLSDAELARQQDVLDKTYALLQAIRTRYPETATDKQARAEIQVIIGHWRSMSKWQIAAQFAERFLKDNPKDAALPTVRQEIARDYLAWAAQGVKEKGTKQHLLDEVNRRHERARKELASIIANFPENDALRHQAQWDVANSFLTQANVIASLSPTLARGQYVRSANELMKVARKFHDHPRVGEVPQMLSNISTELAGKKYYDEAISVWTSLSNNYPLHPLGQQAALSIAQTNQARNKPLQAVEAYVELNFARGGNDVTMQAAIYSLAVKLQGQKRWVESLHALETFVDSFPQHAQAGEALKMIGKIHQSNEVWEDAIAAYDRVILEYPKGAWVKEARWSIAECRINLSRWRDAIDAYENFAKSYKGDPQAALATARIEILKDLERYQRVVDEAGQRKSFDAQYQIGEIVQSKLSNKVKAIIEFRKVADNWPKSHLADDALYQVGVIYLGLGETESARTALLAAAEKYPTSPLADDALLMVGKSYEQEATKFASVTRATSVAAANDTAQRQAYVLSQDQKRFNRDRGDQVVSRLKTEGRFAEADNQVARNAASNKQFDYANVQVLANWAANEAQALTAQQLADRQDKVNAAFRKAVAAFGRAATLVSGDKADDALLRMAQIYDTNLKDADAAMKTWLEIVKQFSGTSVAEDASWKIAMYHQRHAEYQQAIDALRAFLRNYRGSPKAGLAQAAIAENYEHLGKWVDAMDAYTNYLNNFPTGPLVSKAKEQISWIKTYRL